MSWLLFVGIWEAVERKRLNFRSQSWRMALMADSTVKIAQASDELGRGLDFGLQLREKE